MMCMGICSRGKGVGVEMLLWRGGEEVVRGVEVGSRGVWAEVEQQLDPAVSACRVGLAKALSKKKRLLLLPSSTLQVVVEAGSLLASSRVEVLDRLVEVVVVVVVVVEGSCRSSLWIGAQCTILPWMPIK